MTRTVHAFMLFELKKNYFPPVTHLCIVMQLMWLMIKF